MVCLSLFRLLRESLTSNTDTVPEMVRDVTAVITVLHRSVC